MTLQPCQNVCDPEALKDNRSVIIKINLEMLSYLCYKQHRLWHLFIRECVENGHLVVPFVRTHENLADFFTKALPPKVFFDMRNTIMNYHA